MPKIAGKHFPYTKTGMRKARQLANKAGVPFKTKGKEKPKSKARGFYGAMPR